MTSKKYELSQRDWKKVATNALVFAAPALLVLLADLLQALPGWLDGPYLILALWLVNTLTDLIRKYVSGK